MNRDEAIRFHTEEAAAADRIAATAPGTPGAAQHTASANDHRTLADAARLGDYPTDLED